jgi:hypothetical protein
MGLTYYARERRVPPFDVNMSGSRLLYLAHVLSGAGIDAGGGFVPFLASEDEAVEWSGRLRAYLRGKRACHLPSELHRCCDTQRTTRERLVRWAHFLSVCRGYEAS